MAIARGMVSLGLRVLRPATAQSMQIAANVRTVACAEMSQSFQRVARSAGQHIPKPTPLFGGKPLSRPQVRQSSRCFSAGGGSGAGGSGGGGGGGGGGSGGGGGGGSPSLWGSYVRLLETAPVLTKAFTAALMNAAGDIFAQLFVEKNSEIDWKRLGTFTLLGFALVAPALHFWYLTLSKVVTATGTTGTMLRLGLDQFGFAPAFIAVFLSALLTLEGKSADIAPKLKQDWKDAVITNWKLWIPFQFLNFRFVPQSMQVLAANFCALIWNTYLSFASHTAVIA